MENLLTIKQAGQKVGLSVSTLYKMVENKEIPFVKIGRNVRFRVDLLENWINNRTIQGRKIGKTKAA
ncbi:MAG: helix-turn-helix transcriptional regulator [Pseudobacter sp.]|uniref:helix-turn-helix transcriptional regulator n=1 Tax=Pseudobacter sp. TaxID=2045420 RepID=UPI003F7D6D08